LASPIDDQAREDGQAAREPFNGEAITALAVSWLATATTGISLPCGQIQCPMTLPGCVGRPNQALLAPLHASSDSSQSSLLILTSWVVVALVDSQFILQVRR